MPSRFRAREKRSASGHGDSVALLLFTSDRVERAPSPALAVGGSDNIPDLDQRWEDFVREPPRQSGCRIRTLVGERRGEVASYALIPRPLAPAQRVDPDRDRFDERARPRFAAGADSGSKARSRSL